jgi:hypothetical protein
MQTTKLTVNDKVFLLESVEEGQNTRKALASALQNGGGVVDLRLIDGRSVSVLLSIGVVAVLEEIHVAEDDHTADDVVPPSVYDWDYFPELDL